MHLKFYSTTINMGVFTLKKGYLYIALSTFFFSTMEISLKLVAGNFNSIQMTVSRFFVGSLVLLPFAIKHLKAIEVKLEKKTYFYLLGLDLYA